MTIELAAKIMLGLATVAAIVWLNVLSARAQHDMSEAERKALEDELREEVQRW